MTLRCSFCRPPRAFAVARLTALMTGGVCQRHFLSAYSNGFAPVILGMPSDAVVCRWDKQLTDSDVAALVANCGNCIAAGIPCRIHSK